MNEYLMNTIDHMDVEIVDGDGCWLIDSKGKRYLDGFGDTGTVSLGYTIPKNIPFKIFPHHIPNLLTSTLRHETSKLLCKKTNMDKLFFCNSGSESVETAIKIIRKWNSDRLQNNRKCIYSVKGGFHGRTYGAMAATDSAEYHKKGFEPLLEGFKYFSKVSEINPDDCAGIIMAPVFGNNDVIVYEKNWMNELVIFTYENNIPLCFDEVQSGSGRTGKFLSCEWYGIKPDIICLAKGIGMGFPVGVCLAKNSFSDTFTPGVHYSTFGGSPWGCVMIKKMIDWCNNYNLRLVEEKGEYVKETLKYIVDVRGKGLMLAWDVSGNRAKRLSQDLLKSGIFMPTFRDHVIKFTPPLNIEWEVLEWAVEVISECMNRVYK